MQQIIYLCLKLRNLKHGMFREGLETVKLAMENVNFTHKTHRQLI